jgi:hypothetical protein
MPGRSESNATEIIAPSPKKIFCIKTNRISCLVVRHLDYRKHNLVSLFLGFTTTISVHTTVIRASITVLELYYLSLSEYS